MNSGLINDSSQEINCSYLALEVYKNLAMR